MDMISAPRSAFAYLGHKNPMIKLAHYHHRVPSGDAGGKPLDFLSYPHLIEPYLAMPKCRDMVWKKCVQVGLSELGIVFALAMSGIMGRRVAWMMPDIGMARDFVQDKFDPAMDMVPYYRRLARADWRAKSAQSIRLKQIGAGSVRFGGTNKRSHLRSFTVDAAVIDEYDDHDPRHVPMVADRIRNSDFPQLLQLGNPSLPGSGCSALYDESDARRWHHKCERCNERQPIEWDVNIVRREDDGRWQPRDTERAALCRSSRLLSPLGGQDIRPVCRRCHEAFRRCIEPMWVAANPLESRRGYQLNQMDVPIRSVWNLFRQYRIAVRDPDKMRVFSTSVLGEAYRKSGARVTRGDIQGAMMAYESDPDCLRIYTDKNVVMGIDVGKHLHFTVSVIEEAEEEEDDEDLRLNASEDDEFEDDESEIPSVRRGAVIGTTTWNGVVDFIKRFDVNCCVIDSGPERTKAEEFRDRVHEETNCSVYLCTFRVQRRAGIQKWGIDIDHDTHGVLVDRLDLLDASYSQIRSQLRVFPEDVLSVPMFVEHMTAPARLITEKGDRYRWWSGEGKYAAGKSKKADDFRLADSYECLAAELLQYNSGGGFFEVSLS